MTQGPIPEWIYESLPYAYIAAGGVVLGMLQNFPGILSGVLLLSAGLFIMQQRKYYRAKIRREQEIAHQRQHSHRPALEFTWQASFSVGNELLDRQHRRLFALGNELLNAIMHKESQADIELMMDELVANIQEHFAVEEVLMRKSSYAHANSHCDIHADLLSRVKTLRDRFQKGQLPAQELIGFITYDVISQHVIKEDSKLVGALS